MREYKYTVSQMDYLKFNQYHALNSDIGRKNARKAKYLVPLVFAMCVLLLIVAGMERELIFIEAVLFAVLSALWLIFYKKFILWSLERNIRKISERGKLPYSPEGTLVFDDECVCDKGVETESKIKYSSIEKVCATDDGIYIYFGAMQAIVIPNHIFASETDRRELLEFLREKIN